jgi:hypothetical protein
MSNTTGQTGLVSYTQYGINNNLLTPTTVFTKSLNNVNRVVIYYDPDLFHDTVLLSASLLIGKDDPNWEFHYNTIQDEDLGISGTDWKPLEDITIPIYPVPSSTYIIGEKNTYPNEKYIYNIDPKYDSLNQYNYEWSIIGDASFDGVDIGKTVSIMMGDVDTVTIKCKISNNAGCFRYIIKNVYTGTATKKLLIVRYPYF